MTHVASPLRFNIEHVKILDSSPSYFDFPSEPASNMVLKMLAIELWVVRQFNLEIFCSNVYGDNDETMILYQWNELHSGHSNHEHLVTTECGLVLLTRVFNVFTLTKCYTCNTIEPLFLSHKKTYTKMSSVHGSSVLTVKTLKLVINSLNMQNKFISDILARSQSTLG